MRTFQILLMVTYVFSACNDILDKKGKENVKDIKPKETAGEYEVQCEMCVFSTIAQANKFDVTCTTTNNVDEYKTGVETIDLANLCDNKKIISTDNMNPLIAVEDKENTFSTSCNNCKMHDVPDSKRNLTIKCTFDEATTYESVKKDGTTTVTLESSKVCSKDIFELPQFTKKIETADDTISFNCTNCMSSPNNLVEYKVVCDENSEFTLEAKGSNGNYTEIEAKDVCSVSQLEIPLDSTIVNDEEANTFVCDTCHNDTAGEVVISVSCNQDAVVYMKKVGEEESKEAKPEEICNKSKLGDIEATTTFGDGPILFLSCKDDRENDGGSTKSQVNCSVKDLVFEALDKDDKKLNKKLKRDELCLKTGLEAWIVVLIVIGCIVVVGLVAFLVWKFIF